MSLDTLAERVMRKVSCPGIDSPSGTRLFMRGEFDEMHSDTCCHGAGTILDPRWAALREALWVNHGLIDIDPGLGFVRRNRAEAALRLPDAVKRLPLSSSSTNITVDWDTEGNCTDPLEGEYVGIADNWLDALAAALLAWVDAQEVK